MGAGGVTHRRMYRISGMSVDVGPVLDSTRQVIHVDNVEKIERQVEKLSPEELAKFRAWFVEFDWAAWDHQLELDIEAGRLDRPAQAALRDHAAGNTTPL